MTSKEDVAAPSKPNPECCICGDYGLPFELFRCSVCLLRSQHRYCSNLYPKAKSYRVCNWCLYKEGIKIKGTQNSSLPSTCKNSNCKEEDDKKKKKKKIQRGTSQLHIKKQMSLDRSSPRKRIIDFGGRQAEEPLIRRTKSEPIANIQTRKRVFKGKIRRYKLLEEVTC